MPNTAADQSHYLSDHAVRRQIWADIKGFSSEQVYPSLILTIGGLVYTWWTGQASSFRDGLKFIFYSVAAGLAFYILLAVIRAPFIVFGWHLRQISSLSVRLADKLPELQTNFFSGFRVTGEGPSKLEFEVWYFYDGALGNDGIEMRASLENNGIAVACAEAYEDVSFNHRALAKIVGKNQ